VAHAVTEWIQLTTAGGRHERKLDKAFAETRGRVRPGEWALGSRGRMGVAGLSSPLAARRAASQNPCPAVAEERERLLDGADLGDGAGRAEREIPVLRVARRRSGVRAHV